MTGSFAKFCQSARRRMTGKRRTSRIDVQMIRFVLAPIRSSPRRNPEIVGIPVPNMSGPVSAVSTIDAVIVPFDVVSFEKSSLARL